MRGARIIAAVAAWAFQAGALHSGASAQDGSPALEVEAEVSTSEGEGAAASPAAEGAEVPADPPAEVSRSGVQSVPPPPSTSSAPPLLAPGLPPAPPPRQPPSRVFGLGFALGGGFAVAGAYSFGASALAVGPALELPTLEASFFIDDHLSIDLMVPLWNTIVISAFVGPAVAANAYVDFSIGDDWVRFLVGPGVGFSLVDFSNVTSGLSATQVTVGALIGVELLTPSRLFGFRVMSRPYVGAAFVSGISSTTDVTVGGGALLEIGLVWYATDG